MTQRDTIRDGDGQRQIYAAQKKPTALSIKCEGKVDGQKCERDTKISIRTKRWRERFGNERSRASPYFLHGCLLIGKMKYNKLIYALLMRSICVLSIGRECGCQ